MYILYTGGDLIFVLRRRTVVREDIIDKLFVGTVAAHLEFFVAPEAGPFGEFGVDDFTVEILVDSSKFLDGIGSYVGARYFSVSPGG